LKDFKKRYVNEWIYGLNPVLEAIRAGRHIKGIIYPQANMIHAGSLRYMLLLHQV